MKERRVFSREFKHRAASMVIDDNCSVQEVCASLDISATALRRWVDQVRKEQKVSQFKAPRPLLRINGRFRI
ncbi:transposase [Pseudomonas sp. P9_32]|uniref:transposase n=1 Tax=Pseudomonas sp. P9_32 TaxID=3043449 RepID=UPI002A370F8D|nr:transposase [Pseudomonas sp. P9_32]WPN61892.1 transposase [Pseudomonas sp. P9_32]